MRRIPFIIIWYFGFVVKTKKSLSLYKKLQKLLLYICIVFLCAQCAQVTPLTGGKKDDTPPKVLSYKPENASLNFNTKVIEVQFNEYIVLKDVANQFIITPQTKAMPDIQASGKKLKITFTEELLPNTTYKMAFGNSITDLNESNVLQNFEYIFSTGSTIDSLKLSGQIVNSNDKKPAAQILVGLYQSDANDSVIYKSKPLYISKTDAVGNFSFNYLPDSKFKIVGIKDQNKNLLYDGSEEQIAFTKDLVSAKDAQNIGLTLFKEIPNKSFIKKAVSLEYGKAQVIYNKPQTDITAVNAKGLANYKWNSLKDTLTLYYRQKYDTLETFISYESKKIDTLYIKVLSMSSVEKLNKNKAIKYELKSNISSYLPFYDYPSFQLSFPIVFEKINQNKIILLEKADTLAKKIPFKILKTDELTTSFKLEAEFKPEVNYSLTLEKGLFTDDSERNNDSIAYKFKTTAIDDYAQLNLKLFFPKKENYLVMLLNEKEQVVNQSVVEFSLASTSEKVLAYKNLLPGNYFVSIVEDANKNGIFDTGDYFSSKQPETIFVNSSPIKLLAGWEIENEWIVK